ncbi:MAG TPA: T9SS type A sorting domain-containing protein, partial [Parafilimonas sp.]|nr:T9SS type A sorting domain-containing protein [Parafilimonas sp.]
NPEATEPPTGPSVLADWGKNSATIKVKTVTSCGSSVYVPKSVTVVSSLVAKSGITEVKSNDVAISVSPNPTNGKVWISFTAHAKENYSIAVRDVLGKLLLYKDGVTIEGKNQAEIDLSNKPNAVYFVTLVNKGIGQKTMKLIKGR